MKTITVSAFWLFLTLSQLCKGQYMAQSSWGSGGNTLLGSDMAVAGTNPYQVAILQRLSYNFDVIDGKKFICSGAIIDRQWVLTAAQCVANPSLRVLIGVNNIRSYETHQVTIDIDKRNVVVHPNYDASVPKNDVALIKLPKPLEFNDHIQAIALDRAGGDHTNETVFLSGWGRISPFTPVADYLRQSTVRVLPNSDCQQQFLQPFFYIRCVHMCTGGGFLYSEIGACAGDTGAPLVAFNSEVGRPELVGVVTKPPFMCRGAEPTVYTRIEGYKTWIINTINYKPARNCCTTAKPNVTADNIYFVEELERTKKVDNHDHKRGNKTAAKDAKRKPSHISLNTS